MLGAEVRAFKANAPAEDGAAVPLGQLPAAQNNTPWLIPEGVRAPIYSATTRPSPARLPAAEMPQCGVEGEVAFRFRHALPPRTISYTRQEIAESVDACAAIEVVSNRFADPDTTTFLERLADCVSNGGFVYGQRVADWHGIDFRKLRVTLAVNEEPVLDQVGGHPTGDPLGIAVALVELMRTGAGIMEGQFVTCGSYTGLRYLKPGDTCCVRFNELGTAEVGFTP